MGELKNKEVWQWLARINHGDSVLFKDCSTEPYKYLDIIDIPLHKSYTKVTLAPQVVLLLFYRFLCDFLDLFLLEDVYMRHGTAFFFPLYVGFSNGDGISRHDGMISVPPSWAWNWADD